MSNQNSKTALIVLGMHRSGTSALAGALHLLGLDFGKNLIPPIANNNPKGFFENKNISFGVNQHLLETLQSSWDDQRPLPNQWWQDTDLSFYKQKLTDLLDADFPNHDLIGIKDPRLSLLLPFWQEVFQELQITPHYIIMVRHPLEVARSLAVRDQFSIEKSLVLWLNYMFKAELYTRNQPRIFISFEQLLNQPEATMRSISTVLNIDFPNSFQDVANSMDEFLTPELKHHTESLTELNSLPYTAEFYTILQNLTNFADLTPENLLAIDHLREDYNQHINFFLNKETGNLQLFQEQKRLLKQKDAELQRLQQTENELQQKDTELQRLQQVETELQQLKPNYSAQLYIDTGNGFIEADSISQPIYGTEHQLEFDLSQYTTVTAIRFDPLNDRVVIKLHQIKIITATHELFSQQPYQSNALYDQDDLLIFDTYDPNVFIELKGIYHPQTVVVQLEYLSWGSDTYRYVSGEQSRLIQENYVNIAQLQAELDERSVQAEQLQTELQERSVQAEQLQAELDEQSAQAEQLQAELDERSVQAEQLQNQVQKQEIQLTNERGRFTELHTTLNKQSEQLALVYQSTSWKVSKPIRSLGRLKATSLWPWLVLSHRFIRRKYSLREIWRRQREYNVISKSGLFDAEFYLQQNPEVAYVGMDPLWHYIFYGAYYGRNPYPLFDTAFYRETYRDVVEADVNPLWHYLEYGVKLGYSPRSLSLDISDSDLYKMWLNRHVLTDEVCHNMVQEIKSFNYYPKFSIIVPVYNTDKKWLSLCIDSVLAQVYPHFEICLADDASKLGHVHQVLEKYKSLDDRVKVVYREKNGHISAATNSALELATGDYICLLDHDDEISPDALFEFAKLLNKYPDIDMIYSDEDKFDVQGQRYEPFFKPDWSPEYLESCMYTAHFACYRMQIVRKLGGFREGYEGAQDYDFVLRFVERAKKIEHIPKVFYQWRAIEGSTALAMSEKNYVLDSAIRALQDRLARRGRRGTVKSSPYHGCFSINYEIVGNPLISIVIPSAGREVLLSGTPVDLLANCIESIAQKSTYRNYEIIVVDNDDLEQSSFERTSKYVNQFIHFNETFNVAAKMNLGAQHASGEYLLFLNDDTEVISCDWLERLLGICQWEQIGAVGAKLLFEDGTLQHAGVSFITNGLPDHVFRQYPGDFPGYFFNVSGNRNYLAVTGACLLTKRTIFDKVNGFNEDFAVNYNDVDYCLKVHNAGYRIVYTPNAELYHYESQNRKRTVSQEEIDLFLELWAEKTIQDPYYNPNLEPHPPNFQIKAQ